MAYYYINFSATFCKADGLHENSVLDAIFGIHGASKLIALYAYLTLYKKCHFLTAFPSIGHMLHFGPGEGYKCGYKETVAQIPCNTFTANMNVEEVNAEFNITYWWSGKTYFS